MIEPLQVYGFHGTSIDAAEVILREGFRPSRNAYDWLGDGIYFFQDAPLRAFVDQSEGLTVAVSLPKGFLVQPTGLTAIGYTERDLPALIEGTLRQPRLLSGAPRHVGAPELDLILRDAMQYW